MTAMGGVALGLVISSLVADPKTAANIVPLVLIPQIIMGGALIKYEDMNRNLGWFIPSRAGFPSIRTRKRKKNGQQACRCHSSASSSPCAGPTKKWLCPGQAESADEAAGPRHAKSKARGRKLTPQQRSAS
jgi:hypothetical protein